MHTNYDTFLEFQGRDKFGLKRGLKVVKCENKITKSEEEGRWGGGGALQ